MSWDRQRQKFKSYLREAGKSQSTIDAYLRDVESFHKWLAEERPGGTRSPSFTAGDVASYKGFLAHSQRKSPASVNRALQSIRKFGHFVLKSVGDGRNPAVDVPLLDAKSASAQPEILSPGSQERLLSVAARRSTKTGRRDFAILRLMLSTGIRSSELVQLTIQDLRMELDSPGIQVSSDGVETRRLLPLDPETLAALRDHLKSYRFDVGQPLFRGREQKPLSVRAVQQIISKLGRQAGLTLSAKTLRNTYAQSLWMQSRDLRLVASRMGYKHLGAAVRHIR